jgi:hypothetical protein
MSKNTESQNRSSCSALRLLYYRLLSLHCSSLCCSGERPVAFATNTCIRGWEEILREVRGKLAHICEATACVHDPLGSIRITQPVQVTLKLQWTRSLASIASRSSRSGQCLHQALSFYCHRAP